MSQIWQLPPKYAKTPPTENCVKELAVPMLMKVKVHQTLNDIIMKLFSNFWLSKIFTVITASQS